MKQILFSSIPLMLSLLNVVLPTKTMYEKYIAQGYTYLDCKHIPTGKRRHPASSISQFRSGSANTDNWTGYAAGYTGSLSATYIQGTWIVPKTFPTNVIADAAIWVGIDGFNNPTVEQIGIDVGAAVYAWYEQYPQGQIAIPDFPINAGDSITATVQYVGGTQYNMSLANNTQQYFTSFPTLSGSPTPQRAGVEWIVETPFVGVLPPLSRFCPIPFSNCLTTMSGTTGTINNPAWPNTAITLARGDVLAYPTPLSSDGSSFSVIWVSAT